ncbi:Phospho-2-dehydro-3-deoxyheptonate aldolase, Phe-sensitive [compost metagenome]
MFTDVLQQRLQGDRSLVGMMLESHLFEGCQPLGKQLRYGVSVTDGCLGWDATETLLRQAAKALAGQARADQATA